MNSILVADRDREPIARFPSHRMRRRFLEQIQLWNTLEDLPSIDTELLGDGVCVRCRCTDGSDRGITRLVEAFGGWMLQGA